jgi:hypothetical protein
MDLGFAQFEFPGSRAFLNFKVGDLFLVLAVNHRAGVFYSPLAEQPRVAAPPVLVRG